MNSKAVLKISLLTIILLLLSMNLVSAWGVLPAKQLATYDYTEQHLKITIRNNNFDEGFFKVSFAGDLAEYIEYDNEELVFLSPSDSEIEVPFTLRLQSGLMPGKNVAKVILQQIPGQANDQTVSSVLTLVAEVVVNVPYEGNYILAQAEITQVGPTENVPFTISLLNKGEEAVQVWADITIKGPTNANIATWQTSKQILGYLAADKIETSWHGEKESGVYFAEIYVHYGEKTEVLRKEFVVGQEEVRALSILSENFALGQINKLIISAKNEWNDALEGVFAELFVVTKDGQTVQTFKSNPENFIAYESKELTAYWDTTNLVVGDYILQTILHTASTTTQNQFPVTVAIDKLDFAPSGNVISKDGTVDDSSGGLNSLLVILLVVVLITNVIIILYFKKNKKGKE